MKYLLSLLATMALVGCVVVAPIPASVVAGPSEPVYSGAVPSQAQSVGALLNQVRKENGAAAVTYDPKLAQAALRHAQDMQKNVFFSHKGTDGSRVKQRVKAAGFNATAYAENIAHGQQSAAAVMTSWTKSPSHHKANIDRRYNRFGLARVGEGSDTLWVLVLAKT